MENYIPFFLIPFIGWGVTHYLKKKEDYTPLKKRTLAWGIVAYFITEMGRSFYRPFIYARNIDDWVVADTIGNSFGTITAIFMVLTMAGSGTTKDWQIVGVIIAGLIGYEFLNLTGVHPFDLNDVLATVVWGAFSILVYARLLRKYGYANTSDAQ